MGSRSSTDGVSRQHDRLEDTTTSHGGYIGTSVARVALRRSVRGRTSGTYSRVSVIVMTIILTATFVMPVDHLRRHGAGEKSESEGCDAELHVD